MKHQALFSLKDKRKKLKCRLLQFLFGTLRVNPTLIIRPHINTPDLGLNVALFLHFLVFFSVISGKVTKSKKQRNRW